MTLPVALLVGGAAIVAQAAWFVPVRRAVSRGDASWRMLGALSGALCLSGLALLAVFFAFDLEIEQDGPIMWAWVCASAVVVGVGGARLGKRMPSLELAIAAGLAVELAAVLAFGGGTAQSLTSPPVRALLVAPPALGLCAYFGASLGYLLWGSGRADLRLGYEALVGRRFLLSKASPVLSTVTTISVVGVSLGVWLVLVSLGILAGFESDLQRKIIGANAHVVLQTQKNETFRLDPSRMADVAKTRGVAAVAPFLEGEVAVASYSNYTGAQLFGIDPERSPAVLAVLGQLQQGSLEPLATEMRGEAPEAEAPAGDA
ncbi:MAG TPA: ABC transporter permease, partial [Myxococcota bacterium]|nr:ABC transporter permease [Myxococcota bacterium]